MELKDFLTALETLAPKLRLLKKDGSAIVFYEAMSGALMWSDEKARGLTDHEMGCYRAILAIRTGIIIGKAELRFPKLWEEFQKSCPTWIGFDSSRCKTSEMLVEKYVQGKHTTLDWLKNAP
jgi:hypothetical protein